MRRFNPWMLVGAVGVTGAMAVRTIITRNFSVANPALAIRQGKNLTRQARRVMAVSAHQDDVEFLAGGLMRLLSLAGGHITVVVATTGVQQQHVMSNAGEIRNQEERDAGTVLGYDETVFLNLSDLGLQHNPRLEELVAKVWDEVRPDLVLAMDPSFPFMFFVHPDHMAVGRAVLNIARNRADDRVEVLFYGSREPNVMVDSHKVMEDKIQGVLAHKSQQKAWPWTYGALTRLHGRLIGRNAGIPYAESFRALSLPPLEERAYAGSWSGQARSSVPEDIRRDAPEAGKTWRPYEAGAARPDEAAGRPEIEVRRPDGTRLPVRRDEGEEPPKAPPL